MVGLAGWWGGAKSGQVVGFRVVDFFKCASKGSLSALRLEFCTQR